MAGRSVHEILAPKQILKVVSRLRGPLTNFQDLLRFGIGQGNRDQMSGRRFWYDVFNRTRAVARGRRPGAAASKIAPQKVGEVQGVFPRAAEAIPLLDEDLMNRRRVGGDVSVLDSRGEAYITRQEAYLAERFSNIIEFQTAAMLRGGYQYTQQGDDLFHDFEAGTGETSVNFQVPAGNKDQLNMLGTGNIIGASWATASTDIPGDLHAINDAMMELCGYPLKHILCKSDVWQYCLKNTAVKDQAGSANKPWEILEQDENGNFRAKLACAPWITFHIFTHGLDVGSGETYTQLIENDHFIGIPEPDKTWCEFIEGSEIVTEGPNGVKSEQFGFYAYAYPTHDPSGWSLNAVFNGIPALYVPGAVVYGDVTP